MSFGSWLNDNLDFVGGAIGTAGNIVSTAMTNASNRAMQREANEHNERLWREQMQYNDPSNQIARLKGAGLNPNLATGAPNQAGAPPEIRSSKNEAPQVDPMMIANAMMLRSQKDANDAVAERERAIADKTTTENELLKKELGTYDERFDLEKQTKTIINKLNEQLTKKEASLTSYTDVQRDKLKFEFDELKQTQPKRIEKLEKEVSLLSSKIFATDEQARVFKETWKKLIQETKVLEEEFKALYTPIFEIKSNGSYSSTSIRQQQLLNDVNSSLYKSEQEKVSAVMARMNQIISESTFENVKDRAEFETWLSQTWIAYFVDSFKYYLGEETAQTLGNAVKMAILKKVPVKK